MYVGPGAVYDAQLKCLHSLEEQIRSLGVSVWPIRTSPTPRPKPSVWTGSIPTDHGSGVEDLARTVENVLRIAGKYAGKEPPL